MTRVVYHGRSMRTSRHETYKQHTSEFLSRFLTAHQHNQATQCHSRWMLSKKYKINPLTHAVAKWVQL